MIGKKLPEWKKQQGIFNIGHFDDFTYSKTSHFPLFGKYRYDKLLFRESFQIDSWSLKHYQDLLIFAFIKQNIPKGSKLLEIGGGNSRIINYFKNEYQCWNIDKLEGIGNGPTELKIDGFHLVKDYIGNYNQELPDNQFDFVFSISALEHVPDQDPALLKDILDDLNRVLKPGCYSLHCFDSIIKPDRLWISKLLLYFFENEKTLNTFVPYKRLSKATDIFALSESLYNERYLPKTNQPYHKFGKPLSINVLWQKLDKTKPFPQ